ncbi:hypothetical protein NPIL_71181 [Nephila pilipes]|uniref:Uncharacterized protein n=1 Tax=Nephila pilipes TaxID=299642 RepID=A0A8X6MUS3_NEPPI|nr:hypothetical protein NPIL_71181 [Nephila pilipes]
MLLVVVCRGRGHQGGADDREDGHAERREFRGGRGQHYPRGGPEGDRIPHRVGVRLQLHQRKQREVHPVLDAQPQHRPGGSVGHPHHQVLLEALEAAARGEGRSFQAALAHGRPWHRWGHQSLRRRLHGPRPLRFGGGGGEIRRTLLLTEGPAYRRGRLQLSQGSRQGAE